MLIMEKFRDIVKEQLGNLWEDVQREVNEYFKIIDFAIIEFRNNYHKLDKPKEGFLNDPLNIPEIHKLLYSIKEYNFNYFNRNQVTQKYNHYEHGYFIRDNLLHQLELVIKRVENFRIENYPKILEKQGTFETEDKFITHKFEDYGLIHYIDYIEVINGIAFHEKYYVILPNLLRCLLENLLHDIFSVSLENSHKELFFDESRSKIRDFSQLIELLNILRRMEYKAYIKDIINENIIAVFKEIKKIGNYSVHDVIRKIPKSYANEIKDRIDLILQPLLVSFQKLKEKNIFISPERQVFIKEKLGILKKEKKSERSYKKTIKVADKKTSNIDEIKPKLVDFYDMISLRVEFNKGELISVVRDLGKKNINKYLNLEFVDKWDMIFLQNALYHITIYGPGIAKTYNFLINKIGVKENSTYKDDPEYYGNKDIYNEFLNYLKDKIVIK